MSWRKVPRLNRHRWARVRRMVFDRDGYCCRKCGRAGRLECDHVQPLHRGGDPWKLSNVQNSLPGLPYREVPAGGRAGTATGGGRMAGANATGVNRPPRLADTTGCSKPDNLSGLAQETERREATGALLRVPPWGTSVLRPRNRLTPIAS